MNPSAMMSPATETGAARTVLGQVIENSPVATFVIDADHRVVHWNQACARLTGIAASEVIGTREHWRCFHHEPRPLLADLIVDGASAERIEQMHAGQLIGTESFEGGFSVDGYFEMGDTGRWFKFSASPILDAQGGVVGAIETMQDMTRWRRTEDELRRSQAELEQQVQARIAELRTANVQLEADMQTCALFEQALRERNEELTEVNERLKQAQDQLLQSEKMASVGQLAAGVAHEINNPIGYVQSNLVSLERYLSTLFDALSDIERTCGESGAGLTQQGLREIGERHDIEFLKEDIPTLMGESKEGIVRIKRIVQDLKEFSYADRSQEITRASLHKGLDSTLNIAANEIKYRADVVKDYGELPDVECVPSQINQVFMNLLVNAAQAMGNRRGTITVRTRPMGAEVCVEIADDGCGIPQENLTRVFDPFFTTKPVGKGTGLGLSLSYGIVQKHHGRLEVFSEIGVGTTFRMWLPRVQPPAEGPAEPAPANAAA